MHHLTIDLAERYSGAVLMDNDLKVHGEWVSDFGAGNKKVPRPTPLLEALDEWCLTELEDPAIAAVLSGGQIIIEDCHPKAINVKPVMRIQGVLIRNLHAITNAEPILIMPSTWQRALGYKKQPGRSSKGWARDLYNELGFESESRGKGKVDIRDATLMNYYAHRIRKG